MIVQKEVKLALGLTMIFLLVAAALFVYDSDTTAVDAGQNGDDIADLPDDASDDLTDDVPDAPDDGTDVADAGDITPADIPVDSLPEPPVDDGYQRDDGSLDTPDPVPDLPDLPDAPDPDTPDLPDDGYQRDDATVAPPDPLPDLPDASDLPDTPDLPEPAYTTVADAGGETVTVGGGQYEVKKNDTMGKIAREIYGSSSYWPRIQDANAHIPETEMMPGTKLIIPKIKIKTKAAKEAKGGTTEEIAPGTMTYVVRKEDTLGEISKRFYGTSAKWKQILEANRSKIKDEYSMRAGIRIVIPGVKAPEKQPDLDSLPEIGDPVIGEPGTIQKTHIVKDQESLWAIAELYYGSGIKYKKIASANPGTNPDALRVGQKLVIPDLKGITTASGDKFFIYALQDGETLSEVSQKFLGTSTRWKELKALNNIVDVRKLTTGMQIKVPGAAPASYQPTVRSTAPDTSLFPDTSTGYLGAGRAVPGGERTYTVRTGDFLGKIAIQFYGSVKYISKIKEANPSIPSTNEIYVGMKLRIPHIEGTAPGTMTSRRREPDLYEPPVRRSSFSGGSDSYVNPSPRRRRVTPRRSTGGGSYLENFGR